MKVKITEQSKKIVTMEEAGAAKQIVRDMKEDESTAADYIGMAARCWIRNAQVAEQHDSVRRVLEATAEICKNSRVYEQFGEGSGNLDVWIEGVAETWYGFLRIGCNLTDVWQIGPDDWNREFPAHVYARYYVEKK